MGFELLFVADKLSIFMACVSGFVGLMILIYSFGYIAKYPGKIEFFSYMILFLVSMMGLVFSANLLLMYIFWEITAFCSWRLIGFYRKEKDLWCADKAFIVTFFGASVMLVGLVLIYINYGTFDFNALQGKEISTVIFVLLLVGMFSKSAQLPLSSWLPDAGVAPSPVTALLHAAVLVKIGVYAYARLFSDVFVVSGSVKGVLIVLVMFSGLVAALSALRENNIKRILAYSTISQLAYIFLGLIINSELSFVAAMLFILVHSVGKAGLFLVVGMIEYKTHTKDLNELGGLLKVMPLAALSFLLCAFSIIGLPPFGGFFSKFYLILATARAGYNGAAAVGIITALITLVYLFRLFDGLFLGAVKKAVDKFMPRSMNFVVLSFGVISLLIGLFVKFPLNYLIAVSKSIH